jgi:hypothetical protein
MRERDEESARPLPRPRVLISAFACGPGLGSEPGAGWLWSAGRRVTTTCTSSSPRPVLGAALARRPDLALTPVYVEGPRWLPGTVDDQRGLRVRYALWQREVAGWLGGFTPSGPSTWRTT